MIEERALVLERIGERAGEGQKVKVKTQRESACSSCELKSGCGQGALAKIAGGKGVELELENRFGAKPGDIVLVAIPEHGLLKASVLMFLFPLLGMLAGAIVAAQVLMLEESYVALVGVLSLFVGFALVSKYSERYQRDPAFMPQMSGLALSASVESSCPTAGNLQKNDA